MRLSERCYAVTGLAYTLPWVVNAGFIVGDDETLIVDTGANALAAATIHGYASAARPDNRLRVVNTEKHFDHIGGNGFFKELEIPIHGNGIARTAEEFAQEKAQFHPAFHYATGLVNPHLDLPARFELGDCPVDCYFTPGHTPTNISLFVESEGILYCGDCVTSEYDPNLDAANGLPDWRTWLDSLALIERLEPQVVLCGHGPVLHGEDVGRAIGRVRARLTQRIDSQR